MGLDKILTQQIRNSRRTSSSGNLPFELSIQSISEVDKMNRAKDKEAMKQFNRDVEKWKEETVVSLRSSIRSMVRRNVYLSDSLKGRLFYDTKYGKEINKIGFSFAREGIYIHKGAGKGQGGHIGGRWIDKYGTRKFRDEESAGKMATGRRKPKRWFNPVLDNKVPQLADLIADYSASLQIDATRLYIDE